MKFWLKLACRLSPVLVLLACAGGGGGGSTSGSAGGAGGAGGADGSANGLNGNKNNQDTNNTNITGGTGYDYQTPVSKKTPVLQAASYPLNWDGNTEVTPPKVSPRESVYADGTRVVRDGSEQKPFLQSELNAAAITDPNAVVRSVSQVAAASTSSSAYKALDYDLRWGTPDPKGPGYADLYANGDWRPERPLYFWGQRLSGQGCFSQCGPNIGQPATEVMDAWKLGWTGKGVNILMEDFLYFNEGAYHGVITSLLAYRYAPGATFYGWNIDSASLNTSVVDIDNNNVTNKSGAVIKLGVVNASYVGLNLLADYRDVTSRFMNPSFQGQVNYTDAVITKAAGHDRRSSEMEPINKAMAGIPSLSNRVLIVGALIQAGDVKKPVDIASYSNRAGTDPLVNSRYLLASGTTPFNSGDLAVEGLAINSTNSYYSNAGTSYAAPRVAGMVAIVRSKFPNLSASQTASIMLDTARYDTLSCYYTVAGCDKTIYGKGEASLSRALAPVGKLR